MLNPYAKAALTAALGLAAGIYNAYDDGMLTASEVTLSVAIPSAGLIIVWAVSHPYLKTVAAALTAGATALATGLEDNVLSAQEWSGIIVAVLTALTAVSLVKNSPATPKYHTG